MSPWRVCAELRLGALELEVDIDGEAGVLALVGPNGSGKTTLLRLIMGALRPDRGEIRLGDGPVFRAHPRVEVPIEHRRVGYVPQGYGLFAHLDVLDNVGFGLSTGPHALPRGLRREAAKRALAELGCVALVGRQVQGLSGGEQQRVALARALVVKPALLLLDEPLAALDAGARRAVRAFLASHLRQAGCPTLLVTHDARDVAALDATVCVLEAGRVTQRGTLDDLRRAPATDFVAEFVGA